jgi:hypothetical protein
MNDFSQRAEFIAGSKVARLGAYSFIVALVISGVIFKLQPEGGTSPGASILVSVGFVIAISAMAFGACYAVYLAIGSMRAGQFPAPHAHVPTNCKITRGWKAKMSSGLMALSGIFMGAFAIFIVRFALAS